MTEPIIADRYASLQGTGMLTGMPQYFIRFAGCAVQCPIRKECDEQDALKFVGQRVPPDVLADEALKEVGKGGWAHITGGEPCDQWYELVALGVELRKRGLRIHIQTSGMREIPIDCDFITVSPKGRACGLKVTWGHEMVVVYDTRFIVDLAVLKAYQVLTRFQTYYLQPFWLPDGTTNVDETAKALRKLLLFGQEWRLTGQLHKYMGFK